jgi:hypothetical protein
MSEEICAIIILLGLASIICLTCIICILLSHKQQRWLLEHGVKPHFYTDL